ncbi:MAG TPA: large conductance mechanosensitive channel protein MscL [Acidimicrobiales bacterium]|jgi:large conductance mechanosensitive channel
MLREFKAFVMRGNVLDLAVAVILGVAFNAVVQAFADGILMNLIAAFFGQPDFNQITTDVGDGRLLTGAFLTAVVRFVIIAFALFLVVKAFNALQERRRRGVAAPDEAPTPTEEVVLLTEIRDLLRTQPGRAV